MVAGRRCHRRRPLRGSPKLYSEIGLLPDEAFARLQAAKRLLAAGHTAKANAQLQQALAFYRQIDAAATSARPTLWPPHRVGAENSSMSCDLGIFVDESAQSIDPHDPHVPCRSSRWHGRER